MALYTYAPDGRGGGSHCRGVCAAVWPPYLADQGARGQRGFGLVKRDHGSLQWTYNGRPLYRYAADTKPGMTSGDGVNGVWHVVRSH